MSNVIEQGRRLKLVFWIEDLETKEMISDKSQIVATFEPSEFERIKSSIQEAFPEMTQDQYQLLFRAKALGWSREIIDAACIVVQKKMQYDVLSYLGIDK